MAVERINIVTCNGNYYAEADPCGLGFRFRQVFPEAPEDTGDGWVAAIYDNGDNFAFGSMQPEGLSLRIFKPTLPMTYKDGSKVPIEVEEQIEVNTQFGKKMILRHLYPDKRPTGVIMGYSDGTTVWAVAMCTLPPHSDALVFSFAG